MAHAIDWNVTSDSKALLITPRRVVRCRVFDAASFTPRQRGGRWFESTAAHHI
jgi:hypothetical protein